MAKNSGIKASSPSRIRFVMVEAEIGDGDIGQITQAIQNALRTPQSSSTKRLGTGASISVPVSEPGLDEAAEVIEEEDIADVPASSPKPRAARKAVAAPKIIDIDMHSDMSLRAFASGKDAGNQYKKFMIAAGWLKECRMIDGVTAEHIYTCFRSMEWPTNIPDFSQPLRDLKKRQYFVKNEQGEYEINHIGLDYVKKLGGTNGAS